MLRTIALARVNKTLLNQAGATLKSSLAWQITRLCENLRLDALIFLRLIRVLSPLLISSYGAGQEHA